MKHLLIAAIVACASLAAQAQTAVATDGPWSLYLGTSKIGGDRADRAACIEAARLSPAPPASSVQRYGCRTITSVVVTRGEPAACTVQPSVTTATIQCPSGTTGSWQQTTTRTVTPAPACVIATVLAPLAAPAGACVPIVTPPPTGAALHFSDCQPGAAAGCAAGSNANAGTEAAPKQNLSGVALNTLAPGTRLLFKRGGSFQPGLIDVENTRTTAAAPLTFDAYGTGPAPILRVSGSGNLIHVGGRWNNTSNDGGYVFRNLKLDGLGTGDWGVWFAHTVRDVIFENVEITGFRIGINSNDSPTHGVTGITIRNSNIHRNRAMGMLGHYNNLTLEGNLIEANNFSGSGLDHGTYIGGGRNIVIRGNRYNRNSVVNGVCQGGNMTFHGQIEGLLIEGNTIEQDAAAPGCWLMSITQGYTSAEWFRNAVVRGNRLINGGNTAINAQSAPGIVIEGNTIINRQASSQISIGVGHNEYQGGDVPDADAVVRNNTLCQVGGAMTINASRSPGAVVTGNVTRTGADASSGVCAR